jgi:hypothetical protein
LVTGYKAIAQGRYREALHWLDEGMQAVRVLGNARSVFYFAGNQGLARLFLDETDEAARAFGDALAVCADAAAQDIVDECLLGLAAVAARRDDLNRAARLAGAATAHRTAVRIHDEEVVATRLIDEILAPPATPSDRTSGTTSLERRHRSQSTRRSTSCSRGTAAPRHLGPEPRRESEARTTQGPGTRAPPSPSPSECAHSQIRDARCGRRASVVADPQLTLACAISGRS